MSNHFRAGRCFEPDWQPDANPHAWRFESAAERMIDELEDMLALHAEYGWRGMDAGPNEEAA
jgi:hypothetical protein